MGRPFPRGAYLFPCDVLAVATVAAVLRILPTVGRGRVVPVGAAPAVGRRRVRQAVVVCPQARRRGSGVVVVVRVRVATRVAVRLLQRRRQPPAAPAAVLEGALPALRARLPCLLLEEALRVGIVRRKLAEPQAQRRARIRRSTAGQRARCASGSAGGGGALAGRLDVNVGHIDRAPVRHDHGALRLGVALAPGTPESAQQGPAIQVGVSGGQLWRNARSDRAYAMRRSSWASGVLVFMSRSRHDLRARLWPM